MHFMSCVITWYSVSTEADFPICLTLGSMINIICLTSHIPFQFLAAMSSSRSDVVTQCVRPFVLLFLLVSLKFLLVLKSFNGVSSLFKGYLEFKGSFKDVLRKFYGCLQKISGVFPGCFKEVSRVFQGTDIEKIHPCFFHF